MCLKKPSGGLELLVHTDTLTTPLVKCENVPTFSSKRLSYLLGVLSAERGSGPSATQVSGDSGGARFVCQDVPHIT
ncbi:hypothetical protein EYF80_049984 [Liparis tanakae]|uniref:Uncharacterized protein n=1 Tax=Liparis tanakae TaxID=230148 RepID=A0A4Z2FGF9_9TELE|nr:hypothetical protein EYF80_049984 [Liparis tanakae]